MEVPKTKEGICPECGSQEFVYNDTHEKEEYVFISRTCIMCATVFRDCFVRVYVGQEQVRV